MPGFMPGIHVFSVRKRKTWMAGTSPAMTAERLVVPRCFMDGRAFGREDGASRLLPGHEGGEAGFARASCAGLTRASTMRRKSKILTTLIACAASWIAGSSPAMTVERLVVLRCLMDG